MNYCKDICYNGKECTGCVTIEKSKTEGVMWTAVIVCGVLLILWGIGDILYNIHVFRVTPYQIRSSKVKQPFRFVVLSDLHNKRFGKENCRLVEQIRELRPDAVLVAGDLLTAKAGESFENAAQLMEQLSEEYPVYYGLGNHEHRLSLNTEHYGSMYEDYMNRLESCDIHPLINEDRLLNEYGVRIYGLVLEKKFFKRFRLTPVPEHYLEEKIGKVDEKHFSVLIAHNPDYFPDYAKWEPDLVLSGHNHGGIIHVPLLGGAVSPKCTLFPKYDAGLFVQGKSTMLLSRGLGTHTIPVRMLNRAELLYVELLPEEQDA